MPTAYLPVGPDPVRPNLTATRPGGSLMKKRFERPGEDRSRHGGYRNHRLCDAQPADPSAGSQGGMSGRAATICCGAVQRGLRQNGVRPRPAGVPRPRCAPFRRDESHRQPNATRTTECCSPSTAKTRNRTPTSGYLGSEQACHDVSGISRIHVAPAPAVPRQRTAFISTTQA